MENETTSITPQQTKLQKFIGGFNQALPVIGLIYAVFLTVGGYWLYTRDAQTVQAQELRDVKTGQKQLEKVMDERTLKRDQQLNEMKNQMLTRELYEAYHKGDIERMERMEKMLERILEK